MATAPVLPSQARFNTQQADIGFDQATAGDAAATVDRESRINDLINLGIAFELLPHQAQTGVRREVVGQTLDLKVGHDGGGKFNAAIISNLQPTSPARCDRIWPLPALVLEVRENGHGFRKLRAGIVVSGRHCRKSFIKRR